MSLTDQMVAYLKQRAGLTALVTGIYPMLVPQKMPNGSDAYPGVSYQVVGGTSDVALDGPTGLGNVKVQLTCWARSYAAVEPVMAELVDAMSGFKGQFGTATVQGCFLSQPLDRDDPSPGLSTARVYGRSVDAEIWWNEPIPTYA